MERSEQAVSSRSTAPHPYDSANWLSRVTLQWMNTVLRLGSGKPLEKKTFFPFARQTVWINSFKKLKLNGNEKLITAEPKAANLACGEHYPECSHGGRT